MGKNNEEEIYNDEFSPNFKKILIFSVWTIIILAFLIIVILNFVKCDENDIGCNYKKIDNDVKRAEFICSHLIKDGEYYYSLYNMSENIGDIIRVDKKEIHIEYSKLSGRFIGKDSLKLKSIICEVPVDFYFFKQNFYDYYTTLTLRPLVVVSSWEVWMEIEEPFVREEFTNISYIQG